MIEAGETGTLAVLAPYLFSAAGLTAGLVELGNFGLGARRWTKRRADAAPTQRRNHSIANSTSTSRRQPRTVHEAGASVNPMP